MKAKTREWNYHWTPWMNTGMKQIDTGINKPDTWMNLCLDRMKHWTQEWNKWTQVNKWTQEWINCTGMKQIDTRMKQIDTGMKQRHVNELTGQEWNKKTRNETTVHVNETTTTADRNEMTAWMRFTTSLGMKRDTVQNERKIDGTIN